MVVYSFQAMFRGFSTLPTRAEPVFKWLLFRLYNIPQHNSFSLRIPSQISEPCPSKTCNSLIASHSSLRNAVIVYSWSSWFLLEGAEKNVLIVIRNCNSNCKATWIVKTFKMSCLSCSTEKSIGGLRGPKVHKTAKSTSEILGSEETKVR